MRSGAAAASARLRSIDWWKSTERKKRNAKDA
jgi:hypothetical protein